MTRDDVLVAMQAAARAAGVNGVDWMTWTAADEAQNAVAELDAMGALGSADLDPVQRAHEQGMAEHLLTSGWSVRWTTAPSVYDSFGTIELEVHPDAWYGKTLRKVLIDPNHVGWHELRYGSGLHACTPDDPRIEEARYREQRAKEDAEAKAHEAAHAAGLAWLTGLSDADFVGVDGEATPGVTLYEARGLATADVRVERERRRQAVADRERAEKWARCLALVPDGCTLVDDGDLGGLSEVGGYAFRRPRRDSAVYYNVSVPRWREDADRAELHLGSQSWALAEVAANVEAGRLRVALDGEVPPKPVLDRIGHDRLQGVKRYEVDGKTVWVDHSYAWTSPLVLDAAGRMVRKRTTASAALDLYKRDRGY
jgi:hypothetical protein